MRCENVTVIKKNYFCCMNKISINNLVFFLILLTVFSCSSKKTVSQTLKDTTVVEAKTKNLTVDSIQLVDNKSIYHYKSTITASDLKKHLVKLTSDEFEGRRTGENGQKVAANYIADFYKSMDMEAGVSEGQYFQTIPKEFFNGKSNSSSENVLGFIYGIEKPEEVIIISAHYDHLGIEEGKIFKGADDNGSGTAALLEIAKAFRQAYLEDEGPKRSILFLSLTGEEEGLFGSKYYTENPIFAFDKTIANLNIDMVGRVDEAHKDNSNYIYLIGADKLSEELHFISEAVNNKYTQLELDYRYNDENDINRFYYRSDHYNFAKNGIPVIFYFNGVHKDYHKSTDTEEKINYDILAKRAQLVFLTAWELANREESLKRD